MRKMTYLGWMFRKVIRCAIALVAVIAPLFVWWPEAITLWGKFNHAVREWGQDLAAYIALDPDMRGKYEWYRWGQGKFDDLINYFINRLPPNKREHMRAILYAGPYWLSMATQAILAYAGISGLIGKVREHFAERSGSNPVAEPVQSEPTVKGPPQPKKPIPRLPHILEGPQLLPRRDE